MALSVKTREHIRRWAALAGPKWGALLGGAAALAAAIAFTGSALHFTTVADTHGDTVRILTAATDLAAVLQQSGTPPLGEHDEAVWSQTEDGERLDVLRAYTVPVTADGAMQELTVTGTHTTAELLESAGLTYTADDLLTPAADEIVPEGSGITVQRVTYNEYTVDEVVPTEIEEIPTSLFYRKQSKVMTLEEGHDGQDTVVYREKWIDGEWAETNEIERVNEAEMVPTVQKIYGEQAPVSGFVGRKKEEALRLGEIFRKMIQGEATAEEIDELEEAGALKDISHMPARVKCAVLGWRTLKEAIGGEEE